MNSHAKRFPGICSLFAGLLAVSIQCVAAIGAQPTGWADKRLPAIDGQLLWLDASAQPAAIAAETKSAKDGDPAEYWYDSSGNGRHAQQSDEKARPVLRLKSGIGSMRFDGRAASFLLSDLGLEPASLTIFLVAAPAGNEGTFRGLFSVHAKGEDDFRSGINIDLGPFRSIAFDTINVEGAGIAGIQNLRTASSPFLDFRRVCVQTAAGASGVTLHVDGKLEGARPRKASTLRMDQIVIGARSYGGSDMPRGFFAGEIAEIIVYDRALSPDERAEVDAYLAAKYADVERIFPLPVELPPGAIARVVSPPAVQVLVPGFSVRELPLELTNVNNLQYRADQTLVALAYDGNIYLLRDTDGDGLEDSHQDFFRNEGQLTAPIGMALTPPNYKHGQGVVIAAKGKCLLIVDTDGDDQADKEIVVADGWTELPHGVDALGVAFDPRDHAIFFGLGTTNFTDAYLAKDRATAGYRLEDERGTILRVAPDLKSRKVFATGIRFPVAIRFNTAGDLFCTDQEGATWLANGNPFDELLHVERGRHYGFPPRHPRHLPNVIDEPSVYDYRPQHQSTCGLNFNEPAVDGATFGPRWWQSDALVAGYSRGKLYRTKLAHTRGGYVAQNQLIASFTSMPSDVCVAPGGAVVVATHSGGPDWGSGPGGAGKLFKISHEYKEAPLPSAVWPASPQEVRIAFDKPVAAESLKGLAERTAIEAGEFAAAADRLEVVRPGYASVEYQQMAPRNGVEVQGLQLTADRRTLIVSTAPQYAALSHAVALRESGLTAAATNEPHEVVQLPDIDLQYDLSGVEAIWQPKTGDSITLWLPHLNLDVAQSFTRASAYHDDFWQQTKSAGTLVMRTKLDLRAMLRPAVQIGSTIDFELPPEQVTLTFVSGNEFELVLDGQTHKAARSQNSQWLLSKTVTDQQKPAVSIEIRLQTSGGKQLPSFSVTYHTQEDSRQRALQTHRFLLPWAAASNDTTVLASNETLPELEGGNWLRGRDEFFGTTAGCSKCHSIHGQGAKIGPDLSNLSKRDYTSVVRDVTQPSFAINPDYIAHNVITTDGIVLTGTVRSDGDTVIVSDGQGQERTFARDDIEEFEPTQASIMPEGIPKALGPQRMRDLLMFLLVEPPRMPVYGELPPPPARSPGEVDSLLAGSTPNKHQADMNIVLVSGPKDHGLGEHDYPAWQKAWKKLLAMDETVRITTADPWPDKQQFQEADVLVFYQQGSWTPERARDIDAFLRRGGGPVYIHYAVDGGADPTGFAERIGLAWKGGHSKFRHGPLEVEFVPGSQHPIARNFERVRFYDESYWNLLGTKKRIKLLATGIEEGEPQPLFWTNEPKMGGRVFVSIPGHFAWTFDDPIFRTLLLRGIAWTADEPVDRFNPLVLPGARMTSESE